LNARAHPISGDDAPLPADGWRTIRHFAYVERDFRAVRRCLAAGPERILVERNAELHVRRAGFDFGRDVRITVGPFEAGIRSARLPVRWEDATRPGLFPLLDATLEVTPVQAGRRPMTQLGLFGSYRPPFGRLGALTDSLAGHQIVVETVDRFLDDLVERFHTTVPAPSPDDTPDRGPDPPERPGRRRIILGVGRLDEARGGAVGLALRLQSAPGVLDATVNPRTGLAEIDYDSRTCRPAQLVELLEHEP